MQNAKHLSRTIEDRDGLFERPERESNPRIEVLQTPAFPLRHPATLVL